VEEDEEEVKAGGGLKEKLGVREACSFFSCSRGKLASGCAEVIDDKRKSKFSLSGSNGEYRNIVDWGAISFEFGPDTDPAFLQS